MTGTAAQNVQALDGALAENRKQRQEAEAAIAALADRMAENAVTPQETVFISHGDCLEDAKALEKLVRQRFAPKEVVISYVGPVIGAHTGAGVLALFYLGTNRKA